MAGKPHATSISSAVVGEIKSKTSTLIPLFPTLVPQLVNPWKILFPAITWSPVSVTELALVKG
jgi:hypothetical protein